MAHSVSMSKDAASWLAGPCPYAQHFLVPGKVALMAGQGLVDTLRVGAEPRRLGKLGSHLARPELGTQGGHRRGQRLRGLNPQTHLVQLQGHPVKARTDTSDERRLIPQTLPTPPPRRVKAGRGTGTRPRLLGALVTGSLHGSPPFLTLPSALVPRPALRCPCHPSPLPICTSSSPPPGSLPGPPQHWGLPALSLGFVSCLGHVLLRTTRASLHPKQGLMRSF